MLHLLSRSPSFLSFFLSSTLILFALHSIPPFRALTNRSAGPRMSRYCVPASGGGPRRRERVAYVGVECGGRVHLLFSFHTFIISPSIPDVCPSCINTP
ncbi:hypothetical protein B0H17DRAFT_1103911 [Mycena rosella]|uniref:Secreted protein n=1 Tax=Mycena rosella TaxID=1033263 RepID=A0AAD7FY67_MYCRO|nr:hypothetical protein B0H17DRAFT_1103911 [Mycena rosella]